VEVETVGEVAGVALVHGDKIRSPTAGYGGDLLGLDEQVAVVDVGEVHGTAFEECRTLRRMTRRVVACTVSSGSEKLAKTCVEAECCYGRPVLSQAQPHARVHELDPAT
jgi:hypothetical protein